MEENKKKIPEGLLEALHKVKAEDLQYGGEIKIVDEAETADLMTVEVPLAKYEEMIALVVRFNIMKEDFEKRGDLDKDVFRAVMGATENAAKERADQYWTYYSREKERREAIEKRLADMERAHHELTEILRQNKIGPFAEEARKEEGDNG